MKKISIPVSPTEFRECITKYEMTIIRKDVYRVETDDLIRFVEYDGTGLPTGQQIYFTVTNVQKNIVGLDDACCISLRRLTENEKDVVLSQIKVCSADERIESLLNRFGQTISDLPKLNKDNKAYKPETLLKAVQTAAIEHQYESLPKYAHDTFLLASYICHLSDIIDRMEWALNNALVRLQEHETSANAALDEWYWH